MSDITKPSKEVLAYAPVRERVNTSRAFASGVEAWTQLEDQCNTFEMQVHELTQRNNVLEARNEQLEAENVKLVGLYQHHMAMRIQCATGIKNLLDLANAIAIREQIDLAAASDKPADDEPDPGKQENDPIPNIDRALAVLSGG